MAEEIWNNDITSETDWGGDESTGNLPVSGGAIQRFIKAQLKSNSDAIGDVEESLESLESSTETRLSEVEGSIESLENNKQQTETRLSDVEDSLDTIDTSRQQTNTRLTELEQLITNLQTQLESKKSIVVVTRAEWEALVAGGNLVSGTIYGVTGTEDEAPTEDPEDDTPSGNQTAEISGTTLTLYGATYNSSTGTLELNGVYDPTTSTLTITNSSTSQSVSISGNSLVMEGVELTNNNQNLAIVGTYSSSDSALIITI